MDMLNKLTTITGATGKIVVRDGRSHAVLTLDTEHGKQDLDLEQFDSIYRGMVKCWPAIKPLKEQVIALNRTETAAARNEAKEKAKAEKEAAKAKAKADREAKAAAAKSKVAGKAKAAAAKELAKLMTKANVTTVEEAQAKLQEKGGDGKPVLKPAGLRQMKAVVAQAEKLAKLS